MNITLAGLKSAIMVKRHLMKTLLKRVPKRVLKRVLKKVLKRVLKKVLKKVMTVNMMNIKKMIMKEKVMIIH